MFLFNIFLFTDRNKYIGYNLVRYLLQSKSYAATSLNVVQLIKYIYRMFLFMFYVITIIISY